MLANNLTLDDEEAVQEDLRQLEAEAVRLVIVCPVFLVTDLSVQLGTIADVPIQLPHIPTAVPVPEMPTGASSISFTLYYRLMKDPKYLNRSSKQPLRQRSRSRHNRLRAFPYSFEYIRCYTFQEGIYKNDRSLA